MEEPIKNLYICDKLACGPFCPNELCKHTSQRDHAKHGVNGCFKQCSYNNNFVAFQYFHIEDLRIFN